MCHCFQFKRKYIDSPLKCELSSFTAPDLMLRRWQRGESTPLTSTTSRAGWWTGRWLSSIIRCERNGALEISVLLVGRVVPSTKCEELSNTNMSLVCRISRPVVKERRRVEARLVISWCRGPPRLKAAPGLTTGLVSAPGSGNTWLRYLLQLLTGQHLTLLSLLVLRVN